MPYGWFQIGYTDEFNIGKVVPLRYLGIELVAWRDSSNLLHVADAFCPHLGAHLGYGGRLVGEQLRCPFHGWEFSGDGWCVNVPYSPKIPRVGLRKYPVEELGGLALLWAHPDPTVGPLWHPSCLGLPQVEAATLIRYRRAVAMNWKDIGENLIDFGHFPAVHGTGLVTGSQVSNDGPVRHVSVEMSFDMNGVVESGSIEADHCGPGLFIVRLNTLGSVIQISGVTPIDEGHVEIRHSYPSPDSAADRTTRLLARALIHEMMHQTDQDLVIWTHKAAPRKPCLVPADGPIREWRDWVSQFELPEP